VSYRRPAPVTGANRFSPGCQSPPTVLGVQGVQQAWGCSHSDEKHGVKHGPAGVVRVLPMDDPGAHIPPAPRIEGAEHLHSGKVRDLYRLANGQLLMVASDRISAFDWVLSTT